MTNMPLTDELDVLDILDDETYDPAQHEQPQYEQPKSGSTGEIILSIKGEAKGAPLHDVPFFPENTLGQVLDGYAKNLGLKPNASKYIFTNTRTRLQTSDPGMTIGGFGLQTGDTLAIHDDGDNGSH